MAKVLTEHGERKYLGQLFGVSQLTIRRALDGLTNTTLAKKIRKTAIERGGVVVISIKK
ncbi:MAG: DeoR family transcriptional regulator [Alistipes senegalensis]|nr:DeoR family transcriptional regulator [Bacteroides cellulosilyticus]MCM1351354.1 DeoR family transcriptional regulator [Alistipes senegalensis]